MRTRPTGLLVLLAMMLGAVPAVGQSPIQVGEPRPAGTLREAVDRLEAEAEELDEFDDPEHPATFTRPHTALGSFDASDAVAALDRMVRPFTGNEYRDTYIRWHMMWIVNQVPAGQADDIGPRLVALVKKMPPALRGKYRDWLRYEPPEIAAEYFRLRGQTRVTVGYPPFERDYHGEEALKHVSGSQRKALEPLVARMKELRGQFERIVDRDAWEYNQRIRKVNWIIRQYRGELIYAMLKTGDPAMLKLVVDEVERQVRREQRIAFDLMAFVYLAAFEGVLEAHYEPELLAQLADDLESLARGKDAYLTYRVGSEEPPDYLGRKQRNFADYAFHLVHLLREIEGLSVPEAPAEQ